MRFHGNWAGPGWTAGQYKSTGFLTDEDRNVPAIDGLDAAAKQHDIDLFGTVMYEPVVLMPSSHSLRSQTIQRMQTRLTRDLYEKQGSTD